MNLAGGPTVTGRKTELMGQKGSDHLVMFRHDLNLPSSYILTVFRPKTNAIMHTALWQYATHYTLNTEQ